MAKGKYVEWLEPDGLLRIEGWARDGLTDEQIAHNMGISYSTFRVWKDKYPTLSAVLKRGKEVVDREVENALFRRAIGYEYDEVCEEYELGILTKRKVTKKMVVPDTTAQIFWLKNRKRDVWGDKAQPSEEVNKQDDGLIDALNGSAEKDWSEDETGESDI